MATVALKSGTQKPILRPLTKLLSNFWSALIAMGESSSRMRQIKALNEMSDAELAKRGLNREDIVRHIFADHMGA